MVVSMVIIRVVTVDGDVIINGVIGIAVVAIAIVVVDVHTCPLFTFSPLNYATKQPTKSIYTGVWSSITTSPSSICYLLC